MLLQERKVIPALDCWAGRCTALGKKADRQKGSTDGRESQHYPLRDARRGEVEALQQTAGIGALTLQQARADGEARRRGLAPYCLLGTPRGAVPQNGPVAT